ncbi:MAG: NAD(P)/FAD-dependent oxidoreductase [Pseudonocardiaceae bacterium]
MTRRHPALAGRGVLREDGGDPMSAVDIPRVLVLGGGLAGLATALFLARRGQQVDLLERDRSAVPTGVRAAAGWHRSTVPQSAHSHAFLARFRQLLAAEAPDVLAGLQAAGVREIALRPPASVPPSGPTDPEQVVLAARRPVVEWVLRRTVEKERGVRVHAGAEATGLVVSGGRVSGVHVDGGVVDADIVVDASGSRSPVPGWLAEHARPVPERSSPCGITYYTRYWVLHRTGDPGELGRGNTAGGSFDRFSCLMFPADNGTVSITFGVLPEDRDLRELRLSEAFDAAAETIPTVARWVDSSVAVPISQVAAMTGLHNRLRTLAPDGVPVLPGLLGVGDAVCTTNPAYSRGVTLACESALACAQAVLAHGKDPVTLAVAADTAQQDVLAPWFHDSVAQDDARLSRWRPEGHEPAGVPPAPGTVSNADAFLAAQRDPEVWVEFSALQNLLRKPDDVLARPDIVRRVRDVLAGQWRPVPLEAPSHDWLAATVRTMSSRRAAQIPV